MIERLNFYDLYGYLLPGLALLGTWWLPIWLIAGHPLRAEWSSAVAVLLVAYIAGHVLYRIDRHIFRHSSRAAGGRDPSDYLLDDSDSELSTELKARLKSLIKMHFEMDVDQASPSEELATKRSEALQLCRRMLIQQAASSYAPQFQGLYALMRGLMAVALISIGYHAGWFAVAATWQPSSRLMFVVIVVATLVMLRYPERRWTFWLVVIAHVPIGVIVAGQFPSLKRDAIGVLVDEVYGVLPPSWLLIGIVIGTVFLFRLFSAAYHDFSMQFVKTVYRDFVALGGPANRGAP